MKNINIKNWISNPPFGARDHIRLFNIGVNSIIDDGKVVCVQPATTFLNPKGDNNTDISEMRQHIYNHHTHTWLVNPNHFFVKADISNVLSVTDLTKTYCNSGFVEKVVYDITGETKIVHDVVFKNINMHALSTIEIQPIREKIKKYVKRSGSLAKITRPSNYRHSTLSYIVKLIKVGGDIGGRNKASNVDLTVPFYTYVDYRVVRADIKKYVFENNNIVIDEKIKNVGLLFDTTQPEANNEFDEKIKDFCLLFNTKVEAENAFYFLQTKMARFCLSLQKISTNNASELHDIPVVDFTKRWTDHTLYEELALTPEDINIIETIFLE